MGQCESSAILGTDSKCRNMECVDCWYTPVLIPERVVRNLIPRLEQGFAPTEADCRALGYWFKEALEGGKS